MSEYIVVKGYSPVYGYQSAGWWGGDAARWVGRNLKRAGKAAAKYGSTAACIYQPNLAICQKKEEEEAKSATPSWVVPAAIGGGVLVLVLALRRK